MSLLTSLVIPSSRFLILHESQNHHGNQEHLPRQLHYKDGE